MGILDRVATILRSNVNALLDAAEDPELMIDQIIRDQADGIRQARGQVAEMIAEEKRLRAQVEENEKLVEEWGRKAELAVVRGVDDLAREALRRQKDYEENIDVYKSQWTSQSEAVEKLKTALRNLEEKYEATKRQRDALIARSRRARTQQKIQEVSATLNINDPSAELARMEDRIRRQEALAEASTILEEDSFDKRFQELEGDSDIEARLRALKAQSSAKELPEAASKDS